MTIETLKELEDNNQIDKLIQVASLIIIDLVTKIEWNIKKYRDTKKAVYMRRYLEFNDKLKAVNNIIRKYDE